MLQSIKVKPSKYSGTCPTILILKCSMFFEYIYFISWLAGWLAGLVRVDDTSLNNRQNCCVKL